MKIPTSFATKEAPEENNNNDNLSAKATVEESKLFSASRVSPTLLISGAPAVRDDVLLSLGVSCVISAAPELPPPPLPPQVSLVLRLPLKDAPTEDILSQLHAVADTINQVEMVYNTAARAHIPDLYETDYQNTLCFMNNRNFGKH